METILNFIAKWTLKIVVAVERDGVFQYEIAENWQPISEVSKPYNVPVQFTDEQARKILFASDSVDLVSSFAGHNVDLMAMTLDPMKVTKRILSGNGLDDLQEGDALLIAVPSL